ncbi:MAG: hypothetical protein K8I04_14700 [Gammaproteobacteria bacterium]|nr:hypothetical protein [Gammaproteobacteria bacterium]
MDSRHIFNQLTGSAPVALADLPEQFGLYALWDHSGQIRYIGCTPKATEGFRTRIFSKHATGSEGRSHKFTQAYCVGRMWRYCKRLHPAAAACAQSAADAAASKKLRNAFIRKFCGATFVVVPPSNNTSNYFFYLTALESQVQEMAPASMRAWEGIGFSTTGEPAELVEQLLTGFPCDTAAIERQNAIFRKYVLGVAV